MTEQQLLDQAIQASDGVNGLACALGLTNKAVYQWRKRGVPDAWQRVIRNEILNPKPAPALTPHGFEAIEKQAA